MTHQSAKHSSTPASRRRRLSRQTGAVCLVAAGVLSVGGGLAWHRLATAPHIMITSNNLGSVAGGTKLIITGANFQTTGRTQVLFGSQPATTVEVPSSRTVVAVAPAGRPGPVTITVVNPDGRQASQTQAFTYNELKPVISSLEPNSGPVSGGTTVTVHGFGFTASPVKVHVHNDLVTPTVINDQLLTFVTPPQAAPIEVNVEVDVPGTALASDDANFYYR